MKDMRHKSILKTLEELDPWDEPGIMVFIAEQLPKLREDKNIYTDMRICALANNEKLDPVVGTAIKDIKAGIQRAERLRESLKRNRLAS